MRQLLLKCFKLFQSRHPRLFQLALATLQLSLLGQGIAMLVDEMIEADLASGRLQRVLPHWRAQPLPVYAITETRLVPAKVRVLIDFLTDQFNRD